MYAGWRRPRPCGASLPIQGALRPERVLPCSFGGIGESLADRSSVLSNAWIETADEVLRDLAEREGSVLELALHF